MGQLAPACRVKTETHAWLRCLLLCATLLFGVWRVDQRLKMVAQYVGGSMGELVDAWTAK